MKRRPGPGGEGEEDRSLHHWENRRDETIYLNQNKYAIETKFNSNESEEKGEADHYGSNTPF